MTTKTVNVEAALLVGSLPLVIGVEIGRTTELEANLVLALAQAVSFARAGRSVGLGRTGTAQILVSLSCSPERQHKDQAALGTAIRQALDALSGHEGELKAVMKNASDGALLFTITSYPPSNT